MARFQTTTWTTGTVTANASLTGTQTGMFNYMDIVSITVAVASGGTNGTFDFYVLENSSAQSTSNTLYYAKGVSASVGLFDPMDNSSGSPAAALEGSPIVYQDKLSANSLYWQINNNDTSNHTYTITIEWLPALNMVMTGTVMSVGFNTTPGSTWLVDLAGTATGYRVTDSGVQSVLAATSSGNYGYVGTLTNQVFKVFTNNTLAATFDTSQNLTLVGNLVVSGTGPHAIGTTTASSDLIKIGGTFAGQDIFNLTTTLQPTGGLSAWGIEINATLVEAGSGGAHPALIGLLVNPAITDNAGTGATNVIGVEIPTIAAGAHATNGIGIRVAQPSGATNNYIARFLTTAGTAAVVLQDKASGYLAQVLNQQTSAGTSFGLNVQAGTNASDTALIVQNQAANTTFLQILGTGTTTINAVGPHAIGVATGSTDQLKIGGSFAGGVDILNLASTLTPAGGASAQGIKLSPTLTEAGSGGAHPVLAGITISPTITDNAATGATVVAGIDIAAIAAGAHATSAYGLRVAVPTGAGTNYAIHVLSGVLNIQTGGSTTIGAGTGTVKMSTGNSANNAAWIPISYAGTTYFIPAWTTNAP